MTITEVSRGFNISTRTLRYYEQIGLLTSIRLDNYAYRTYDDAAVTRLRQIIVLRKLRIPLKLIRHIFQDSKKAEIMDIFQKSVSELDAEIAALTTIRAILNSLIIKLNESIHVNIHLDMLKDDEVLKIVEPLSLSKINFKEEKSMNELNEANQSLNKLRDHEVRIVYLPPAMVASICCKGGMPEIESGRLLNKFIIDNRLYAIKPDFRHYGFNNPNGSLPDGSDHGYERWITIPDEMEVQPPFTKKHFAGGLYCAHMIPMGNFDEWFKLLDWVQNNGKYTFRGKLTEQDCIEEHLNYINKYTFTPDDSSIQIDLLLPVKEK